MTELAQRAGYPSHQRRRVGARAVGEVLAKSDLDRRQPAALVVPRIKPVSRSAVSANAAVEWLSIGPPGSTLRGGRGGGGWYVVTGRGGTAPGLILSVAVCRSAAPRVPAFLRVDGHAGGRGAGSGGRERSGDRRRGRSGHRWRGRGRGRAGHAAVSRRAGGCHKSLRACGAPTCERMRQTSALHSAAAGPFSLSRLPDRALSVVEMPGKGSGGSAAVRVDAARHPTPTHPRMSSTSSRCRKLLTGAARDRVPLVRAPRGLRALR